MSKRICSDDDWRRHIENKRFGRLVITRCISDKTETKGYSNLVWEAKCDCGNITTVLGKNVIKSKVKSCGCYRDELLENKKLDLLGKRFGNLVVTKYLGVNKKIKQTVWKCVCDCGKPITVNGGYINSGKKLNCGCKRKPYKLKHDLTGVKFDDWKVIKRAENRITPNGHPRVCWVCQNSNGITKTVFATYIMEKLKNN